MTVDNENVIIESIKNEDSFNRFKSRMIKIASGVAIAFFLFYFILGGMSPDDFGLFFLLAVISVAVIDGIVWLIYWLNKTIYNNVSLIVTNKGLTHFNRKNGFKNFIPTNQISSVSCIGETIRIITIDVNQPLSLGFVKNASELKKVLDDLIYKTEKQKEVIIVENQTQVESITTQKSNPIDKNKAIEEIKQFKELLDVGIITQEEFDAKKKELLGL